MAKAKLTDEVKTYIVQAMACFDTPSIVAAAVRKEPGVELGPGNHVDHFGYYLLSALGIAAHGAGVGTCDGCRSVRERLDNLSTLFLVSSPTNSAVRGLRVQFQIDRLPPRRLRSPLCRRQFVPAEVFVDQ